MTITTTQLNLIYTISMIVSFLVIREMIKGIIKRTLKKHQFDLQRKQMILKTINFMILLMIIIFSLGIWGLKSTQVLTFLASVLAVIGVAFFAQWSLLSNITAGLILFFNHPLKIGDKINIIDSTPHLKGKVVDIALFFMHLKDDDGITFIIPNSVIVQKTLIILKPDAPVINDLEETKNPKEKEEEKKEETAKPSA